MQQIEAVGAIQYTDDLTVLVEEQCSIWSKPTNSSQKIEKEITQSQAAEHTKEVDPSSQAELISEPETNTKIQYR